MEKTKLEIMKDALTAVGGLVTIVTDLTHTCEESLGQDYGLFQVEALLRLTQEDLAVDAYFLGITDPDK